MYYSKFCLTLLIRITINAVTVMFAVMNLFPKLINAVIVRPVKMYQTISKHIMFWCHYRFFAADLTFEIFLADVGITNKYARADKFNFYATTKSWHAHQTIRLDELIWTKRISEIFMEKIIELSIKPFQNPLLWHLFVLLK